MSIEPIQPDRISQLLDAVYPSFALLAGMELDLFTNLDGQARSLDEIADGLGVNPEMLRPLLFALTVSELLVEENDNFRNSAEAQEFLVQGKSTFLGSMQGLISNNWKRVLDTASTIRNGGPLTKYNYHTSNEEMISIMRGLYPGTVRDAHNLMTLFDFSGTRTLLDVGGGSGGLAISLAEANPGLSATVIDLPSVTPITRQFIEEAGLENRIAVESANAVTEKVSGNYEIILARHLFQVLSAEDSRSLLGNILGAIKPGGQLIIIGWVLDDSRRSPEITVGYNLILLNGYENGQAYTESEYKEWLGNAGYEGFQRTILANGDSIIMTQKPKL